MQRFNQENNPSPSGGIGFIGLLTILFIGLKLTDIIAWSWWWVLAPIWLTPLVVIAIVFIVAVTIGVTQEVRQRKLKKRKSAIEEAANVIEENFRDPTR